MLTIFVGLPVFLALLVDPQQRAAPVFQAVGLGVLFDLPFPPFRMLMPALFIMTLIILSVLLLDRSFDKRLLWNWRDAKPDLFRICLWWLVGLVFAVVFVSLVWPDQLFSFPRRAPQVWAVVMLLYPWLSAFPQEITHRAFFFHRYRCILPGRWQMILVNALVFCLLHVVFWNWIALGLTLVGGVLFAYTYDRTRSTLAATIEHALYGNTMFTVGLGSFLFAGALNTDVPPVSP
ncbi:MAG: CPBP family intramembrane glutamic endopeptidase [Planctomycetota bacterium]